MSHLHTWRTERPSSCTVCQQRKPSDADLWALCDVLVLHMAGDCQGALERGALHLRTVADALHSIPPNITPFTNTYREG